VAEELGQDALAGTVGVEQGAEQELGVTILFGEVLEKEAGGWRVLGWGAVTQVTSDAYLP
jgi:hypothetical protein